MNFRYAVTSSRSTSAPVLGAQLGDDVSVPLVATVVPTSAKATDELPGSGSLCVIDRGEVRLVQATPSRDGREVLFWLNNLAEEEVAARVSFPDLRFNAARVCTVFEEGPQELALTDRSVSITLQPGETRGLVLSGDLAFAPAQSARGA